MPDITEAQTRKEKIDVLLKEQGWDVKDSTKVIIEVDTKQSDFKTRDYKTISETLRNDEESKYADYMLVDKTGSPMAIIEAKRTSKDPILGQKQAMEYADDIKAQTGKEVFIFLTNGYEIWFWNRPFENPRMIKGFYTRSDLERVQFQNENKQDLSSIEIDSRIIDRSKSIECTKRVVEHLQKGNRKALIVMATGTGKTRVAMAIIDILMKANRAEKILFLADRRALRDQAYDDGFKQFFPEESKSKIYTGTFEKNSRLYVSTIQTFMECYNQRDSNGKYLISPGEFDILISDESHRSIYNLWKDVFTYLDAVQIGLTATPAEIIDRDTFRFFNCQGNQATTMYSYEEAVNDGVLCDFKVHGAQTHFQIDGVKKEDVTRRELIKLLEKGVDPEEINFEGTDIEKKVAVLGTNEALAKEFMDNCLMDETGTIPAKTIIFAITKQHAKRIWEAFEKLYPEYKGRLARVIVSEDPRAQDSIKEFKHEKWPRVAISVDMLDTGIDVPEVCNLVFAKPIFSKIKFWQMIGRGTRSNNTCKHKDWLPNGKKEFFKIFDFWNNFEFFDMKPEGDQQDTGEAITSRIFRLRLKQLEHFTKISDADKVEEIKTKILEEIKLLPQDSISIRECLRDVEKALSPKLWDSVGIDPIEFLKKKIGPLMRFKRDVNIKEASFISKVERLGIAILENNTSEIERLKKDIGETIECLPRTINVVKDKEELLDKVLSKRFWEDITFEDTQMLLHEITGLMQYKRDEPRDLIILDLDDIVQQRTLIEFGPVPSQEYVDVYKEKVETRVKSIAEEHPTIMKIKNDEILTEDDFTKLEDTLNSPELFITEDTLQKVYKQHKGTLVQFIKKILGLYEFPKPEDKIKDAFQTYIIDFNKDYNADQLNFLRTIQSVFISKKHIEFNDLFEPPFTNFGADAPVPMFEPEELVNIIRMCNDLESDVFGVPGGDFGV